MSSDTKWIIGTMVVLAGLLSAQMSMQFAALNTRIDDTNTRIDDTNTRIDDLASQISTFRTEIRDDLRRFDDRLRAVEVAFGKIDQRLLTIERVVLPSAAPDE